MADLNRTTSTGGAGSAADWGTEDRFWRENFSTRPYRKADRGYEHYQPGYRYGFESANRYSGREWNDVEPELRSGWDSYEHRGSGQSTWEDIKDSVRDAWDKVRGRK